MKNHSELLTQANKPATKMCWLSDMSRGKAGIEPDKMLRNFLMFLLEHTERRGAISHSKVRQISYLVVIYYT